MKVSKGEVDVYLCEDGVLIYERNENMIHTWFASLDLIKIIKSKRTIQQIIDSL